MNTAIEAIVDLITDDYHELAKIAKDVAAGAVLVTSVGAVILGYLVLSGHIFPLFNSQPTWARSRTELSRSGPFNRHYPDCFTQGPLQPRLSSSWWHAERSYCRRFFYCGFNISVWGKFSDRAYGAPAGRTGQPEQVTDENPYAQRGLPGSVAGNGCNLAGLPDLGLTRGFHIGGLRYSCSSARVRIAASTALGLTSTRCLSPAFSCCCNPARLKRLAAFHSIHPWLPLLSLALI